MKDNFKIAAAIDIGSSAVRMKIAQTSENEMQTLENLEYPLNIGKETFNQHKIQFVTMEAGCEILSKYYNLANELGVTDENITLTGTTALRESENKDYVCDQIMVKTGHKVKILEDVEEKTFIFRHLLKEIIQKTELPKYYLMAYIGTGSLGIALCNKDKIFYSQNIRTGSLKLTEILDDMTQYDDTTYLISINELIDATFDMLKTQIKKYPIERLYITGKEVNLISNLCNVQTSEKHIVSKEALRDLYNSVSDKRPVQLKADYGLSHEHAEILLPSLVLYQKLLSLTNADSANLVDVSLCDAILYRTLFPAEFKNMKIDFERSSVASALVMASHYKYDKSHANAVQKFSLTIFDNLKKIHGFSRKERLYLELAAILHDIGKYVGMKAHNIISANLILDSHIIGLTEEEIAIVANIARYHSNEVPTIVHSLYNDLSVTNRITVSKLSAIIRLADALDRSHLQKIKKIDLKLVKNLLTIKVNCIHDIVLEQWTFKIKSDFFEEVFGIKCRLINKS